MVTLDSSRFIHRTASPLQLNDSQLKTLGALMETFIQRLVPAEENALVEKRRSTHTENQVRSFCQKSGLDYIETALAIVRSTYMPNKQQKLSQLLSLISSPEGIETLTGQNKPFVELSVLEREKILTKWSQSSSASAKTIFKLFRNLSMSSFYLNISEDTKESLNWKSANLDFPNVKEPLPMLADIKEDSIFDVIVIGSGAGGGVVASQLAEAGQSVLVIEKGKYFHESKMQSSEIFGYSNMYEGGGPITSTNSSISMVAGSTFGGGTTINWCICLRPPPSLIRKWVNLGLSYFESPEYAQNMDKVLARIGASTDNITKSGSSEVLLKGCRNLGYHAEPLPQNSAGKKHACGSCFAGCSAGVKNGTMNTWLRDAFANGAQFLDQSKVKRVLIEGGKAVGVECELRDGKIVKIGAKCVVVSGGSLQSPGILLRSGLKNPMIGRHLRLHPVVSITGIFKEPIQDFQGDMSTMYSKVAYDTENDGYGSYLESMSMSPAFYSSFLQWRGGANHKDSMLEFNRAATFMVLIHDKDSESSVKYDERDNVVVEYSLSERDTRSMIEGIQKGADIMVGAGARKVISGQLYLNPFEFREDEESTVSNPRFITWKKKVKEYGAPVNGTGLTSAHQMSSNRMGTSPKTSVVQPTGETWETKNLYVADSSVLPTSPGVNPMVIIETIALHISSSILERTKLRGKI
ncbi:GMC oxidoreductase-domain-containing protein [Sporodiniella umbellata]|nr:GMC oxidoreductase-domain-containing protein [Sporodiniella umbellata]